MLLASMNSILVERIVVGEWSSVLIDLEHNILKLLIIYLLVLINSEDIPYHLILR